MKTELYYAFHCDYCGWEGERDIEIVKWHFTSISDNYYCPVCIGAIPIMKSKVMERKIENASSLRKLIENTIIL